MTTKVWSKDLLGLSTDWYTNTKGYDTDGVKVDPCIFGTKVAYIVKSCYVDYEDMECHVTVTLQPLPKKEGINMTSYVGVKKRDAIVIEKVIDHGVEDQNSPIDHGVVFDMEYLGELDEKSPLHRIKHKNIRDLSECGHVGLYGHRTYYYWTDKHEYPSPEAFGLFGQDALFVPVAASKTDEYIHHPLKDITDMIVWLGDARNERYLND